jgi:formate hydrogenlyase subunit 3/multisubunit Na+/H+ antiporter MnhD subunit
MSEVTSWSCITLFLVPVAAALLILLMGRSGRLSAFLAVLGMAVTAAIAGWTFVMSQKVVLTLFDNQLRMDSLSGLVSALVALIGLVVVVYSVRYLEHERAKGLITERKISAFYWQVMLFIGSMLWATTTNNIIMLWVIIEATTLASALLVAFYWNRDALEAGYKYIMLLTVGISFALFGCVLLYSGTAYHAGGQDPLLMTVISSVGRKGLIPWSIVILAVSFFIVGFGTKAGMAPFHAWLPDAHAEAPSPVSALLSGVMIKVGIYALIRTIAAFYSSFAVIPLFLTLMGIFTMVVGVGMMFLQEDIKRFLAYSSVSQVGYILMGFGLAGCGLSSEGSSALSGAYLGMYGSLFHLVNHGIIKALLFLCAGAVVYATGIRRIRELGGLGRKMPLTSFCVLVGSLAISGVPLLNGFMSKFTLFLAGIEIPGMYWTTVAAILCSILTLACFIHVAYRIFMGPLPERLKDMEIKDVPASMAAGMLILCLLCFLLGICPQVLYPALDGATRVVLTLITGGGM